MNLPGKMIWQVLSSLFKKPSTTEYPYKEEKMPEGFRGEIEFYPEKCIGCMLCVKDCPSDAIIIRKLGEKKYEAEFDLAKCIYCGQCVDSCLKKALEITGAFELAVLDSDKLKVKFNAESKTKSEANP